MKTADTAERRPFIFITWDAGIETRVAEDYGLDFFNNAFSAVDLQGWHFWTEHGPFKHKLARLSTMLDSMDINTRVDASAPPAAGDIPPDAPLDTVHCAGNASAYTMLALIRAVFMTERDFAQWGVAGAKLKQCANPFTRELQGFQRNINSYGKSNEERKAADRAAQGKPGQRPMMTNPGR